MTDRAFKHVTYKIDQSGGQGTGEFKEVSGFAFETPGWPEFHACVRARSRDWILPDDEGWIVDHFESGLAIRDVGTLAEMTDAPQALAKLLHKKGRRLVRRKIKAVSA